MTGGRRTVTELRELDQESNFTRTVKRTVRVRSPSAVHCPPFTAALARLETAHAGTSPAPDMTATVAPFRAWRGSRVVVAEKPT